MNTQVQVLIYIYWCKVNEYIVCTVYDIEIYVFLGKYLEFSITTLKDTYLKNIVILYFF